MSFTSIEPPKLDYRKYLNMSMKQDLRKSFFNRKVGMISVNSWSIQALDLYFPLIVFFYGLVVYFVLEIPFLVELAQKRMPSQYVTFQRHRKVAILSLYIGGIWSLQNLWFS